MVMRTYTKIKYDTYLKKKAIELILLCSDRQTDVRTRHSCKGQCFGAGAVEPPYFAGAGAIIFVKKRLRLRTR